MSTKNLARTVIEGGRSLGNRFDRWGSNARFRANERGALSHLRDATAADDFVAPVRRHVYRGFQDKLSAPKRWLASQVGRPWNLVRGELFSRFDTRTTAGRHIVFDHMLRWVKTTNVATYCDHYTHFQVDRHGILRDRRRAAPPAPAQNRN